MSLVVSSLFMFTRPLTANAAGPTISTVAGNGSSGFGGNGGPAVAAQLNTPTDAVQDAAGNVYIADLFNHEVRKVDTSGNITDFAGNGTDGNTVSTTPQPATSVEMDQPFALLLDSAGDLYIADQGFPNRIYKVFTNGTISVFAGNGTSTASGDGGPAINAGFNPQYMVQTSAGFFFTDFSNNNVRKIDSTGNISTFASGISSAEGLTADPAGNLYATEYNNNQVVKIDTSGGVTVVAGSGGNGYSGDGGPATAATLNAPYGVAFANGSLFISDSNNAVVRQVDPTGTITTVVGNGSSGYSGDGGPATSASLANPSGLHFNTGGDLFVSDFGSATIRKVTALAPHDLLALSGAAPAIIATGQAYAYTLSVTDPGGVGNATGVTLSDTLPVGVAFVSATATQGTCTTAGSAVTCTIGAMAVGATVTVTINVTAPTAGASLTNSASVTANETDPFTLDNSTSETTFASPDADLSVTASASPTPAVAGRLVTFRMVVRNAGPASATNVALTNSLTAGVPVQTTSASQGSCATATAAVTCNLGTLSNGASATASFVVVIPASVSSVTNTATVSADQADPNPADNSATASVPIVALGSVLGDFAGNGGFPPPNGDGGLASAARVGRPVGIAGDSASNIYIAESIDNVIRKVDPSGIISTVAGTTTAGFSGDGGPAASAELNQPSGVAVDSAGDLLIADSGNNVIRSISPSGTITTVAGNGTAGYGGDGGPAKSAELNGPQAVTALPSGGFLISDTNNHVVRKVNASGTITTLAGTGTAGLSGNGGPATSAQLNQPQATAVEANGDIFIADCGSNEIRKVDQSGTITAFAGNGIGGFSGDGGPATLAEMNCPTGLSVDGDFVFFSDTNNLDVRQVDPFGTISTIAGHQTFDGSGCKRGTAPLQSGFASPAGLFMDPSATLYIADTRGNYVCDIEFGPDLLKVTETAPAAVALGQTYTYNSTVTNIGGAGTATGVSLSDPLPSGLTFVSGSTSAGSCAFSGGSVSCPLGQMPPGTEVTAAISVTAPTNAAGPVSNTASVSANETDPAPQDNTASATTLVGGADVAVTATQLPNPAKIGFAMTYALSVNDAGPADATGVSVTDTLPQDVAFQSASSTQGTCSPAGSTVTCALGTLTAGGSATVTLTVTPAAQTPSPLIDTATVTATQPDPNTANNTATVQANLFGVPGTIYTIAGMFAQCCAPGGDGGPAIATDLFNPSGVVGDGAGNIYVSESGRNDIRRIDPNGIITTFAGTASGGFSGDGGPATAAKFNRPFWLSFDAAGNLLVADSGNDRIRSISPSGIVTTVAGNGTAGYSGDGGAATSAALNNPLGVVALPSGGFLIGDEGNNVIRKVDASGRITTFAGTGTAGYSGDGGLATSAKLNGPFSAAVDPAGNVFIADFNNSVVRKVDPSGTITTFAGNGTSGGFGLPTGDGGPATSAELTTPAGIAFAAGSVYISDRDGSDIRRVDPNGIITTVVGGAGSSFYSGDGGPASQASVSQPLEMFFDTEGNLDIAVQRDYVVRQIADLAPNLLHLTGAAPTFVNASQQFSYTFQVSNPGSVGGATGVTLSDPLPSGLTYVSSSATQGSCSVASTTVTCALGALPASSSAGVTITVTGPASATDITNTATVSANETDPQTSDNSVAVVSHVGKVDVSISQTASQPAVSLNQQLTFSMNVASNGSATGVLMTDALPSALQFVSATPSQGACSSASGTVTCALGSVPSGGAAQISVTVKATKAGSVTNTAAVVADQPDVNLQNNSASATSFINPISCGEVITTNTKLTADVGPCYGDGVIIGADGITLDLNGHSVLGLGTRLDDMAGIRLPLRSNVTIENGTVTGFAEGIFVNSGGGNTITNMNIHDNIGPNVVGTSGLFEVDPDFGDGILLQHSAANKVLNSTITHNGIYDGIGIFGLDSNFNLVQGNTISKNVHANRNQDGEGIAMDAFLELGDPRRGESLYGNKVIGNTIVDNQASGISSLSNVNGQYVNNDIERNGLDTTTFPNNGIGLQDNRAANPNTNDLVQNNKVVGNGNDGIQAASTRGNQILNNTTNGNNAIAQTNISRGRPGFDLSDFSGNCAENVWKGNTYGTGGVNPACLANTNTGPSATTSAVAPTTTNSHRSRHQVGPTFTGSPAASSGPVAAPAATSGTSSATPSCGATITASITLTANIGPCPGSGLVIGADNITVNLGGHSITGTGTGDGTRAGVMVFAHQGVTVTNGSISNFDAGVAVNMGANNTVTKLNIHDNIGPGTTAALSDGIAIFHSFATQILNNTLTHNGTHSGIGVYGLDSNATVIKNNVVTATAGQHSVGILVTALLEPNDDRRGLPIDGNSIASNTVTGNQGAGIVSVTNTNALIQSNQVAKNGVGLGSLRDGIQLNYDAAGGASPRTADSVLGNKVSGNGDNGIAVYSRGNTIQGNSATGDNVNVDGSFDLFDNNPGCDHNVWQGNTSGSAGFSPSCA